MHTRSAELTTFLESLERAVDERAGPESDARRVTRTIMRALEAERPSTPPEPASLPVCALLDDALDEVATSASQEHSSLIEHAQALHALSPQLAWWRRPDAGQPGEPFADGHANATVIGQGGLEERDDVWIGISLMAPGLRYPEHHHPPEEVYLVLSSGHWQQDGGAWHEPGVGGLVHNPSDVLHAMRSGSKPLLAVWCLWKGT